MRISHSNQGRLDCEPVQDVSLNLECRDEIIPVLYALQHIYKSAHLRDEILNLVGDDVNPDTSPEHGRDGLSYWEILVLAAVRLSCNLDYDRLQDRPPRRYGKNSSPAHDGSTGSRQRAASG